MEFAGSRDPVTIAGVTCLYMFVDRAPKVSFDSQLDNSWSSHEWDFVNNPRISPAIVSTYRE